MDWISVLVVTIVSVFFLAVMYKALKDPIDLVIQGIKNTWFYITGQVAEQGGSTVEVIRYE